MVGIPCFFFVFLRFLIMEKKELMTKALFFDIDGTLVSFGTHTIPPSAIEALTAARKNGHKIFIATGRPKVIINNLAPLQERGLIDGYITMNGGYCFVGDEVIYKSAIPTEDVQTLARLSREQGFPCVFVQEHTIAVCQPNALVDEIFHDFLQVDKLPIKSLEEATDGKVYQISPFITADEEMDIAPLIPSCELGRWFPAFTDVTAKGNTKQRGMDEMIRHFELKLEDTMSFGDGGNDISMLRHAAIGVAMGNAKEEIKEAANYVTASVDEDGIQKALKHFGIID